MKLRNKKTGEIVEYDRLYLRKPTSDGHEDFVPNTQSLTELNEEWEDYEEQEYCFIANCGDIFTTTDAGFPSDKFNKEIGNYFETKEEAEKAVEKLKAWKRLKDKGFRFTGINDNEESQLMIYECGILCKANFEHSLSKDEDFILLFGGEE